MAILNRFAPSPFFTKWQEALAKGMTPGKEKIAREWLRTHWKGLIPKDQDPQTFIKSHKEFKRRDVYPGFMYQFEYDAKTKDKLPYWDKFPLIFVIQPEEGGFLGLNLHYLNRPMRARLMDALYNLAVNKKYNDNQKLALSYELLKSSTKYRWFKPCVKRYLYSHVRSNFYKVPAQYWDQVLFLPTEAFQKQSKTKVWEDSARKIRESKK